MGRRRWGRIRQLPSGRFQARYPGPDGTLYPADQTFPTKTDADLWLTDKEAEIRRTGWRDPSAGKVPLADYAEKWINERRGLAPSTVALYRTIERCHIRPYLGDVHLVKITPARVRTWMRQLQDDGAGQVTVAKSYRLLKAIMATAVEEDELIPRNPCRVKGAGKEQSAERKVPTVDEVYAITDHLNDRYRALVLLAATTGLRWGELMALRRRDLDLRQGVVRVRASLTEVGGELIEGPPKSEAGKRTVAIPEAIVPDLTEHLRLWAHPGRTGLVFTTRRGTTPKRSSFGTQWRRAVKDAGATPGLHFHDLRHFANDVAAGIVRNLKEQMRFMGHASTEAALRYQHEAQGANFDVAEGISKRIQEAKGHGAGTKPNPDESDPDGEVA